MKKRWIDTSSVQDKLGDFFTKNKSTITEFGNTVNQTFEAFVFASLVNWYATNGWSVEMKNPGPGGFVKLKFNTRGRPSLYTYALCIKDNEKVQIRHGLRVATYHHRSEFYRPANIVLDVAVISDTDLSKFKTDEYLDNSKLLTFGEAKHMSAFAELIANFIGLVHELSPHMLTQIRMTAALGNREHPAPFLYVSGYLYPTAQGLVESIKYRGYDVDIYDYQTGSLFFGITLPTMKVTQKSGQVTSISVT